MTSMIEVRFNKWKAELVGRVRAEGMAEGVEYQRTLLCRQAERKFGAETAAELARRLVGRGRSRRAGAGRRSDHRLRHRGGLAGSSRRARLIQRPRGTPAPVQARARAPLGLKEPSAGEREGAPSQEEPSAGEREGAPLARRALSRGARGGTPRKKSPQPGSARGHPSQEEPSAGEREGAPLARRALSRGARGGTPRKKSLQPGSARGHPS